MKLNKRDNALLNGDFGPAAKLAMSIVVRMAKVHGALQLLDITQAHIDSSIYMGDAGLEFAERLADLGAQGSSHIAVTGDLVNISLPAEFGAALAWLRSLGDPAGVTVVPGNHDAYVKLPHEKGIGLWRDYMAADPGKGIERPANGSGFPFVRLRGPCALIGLSTAVPTLPFLATGRLDREQLAALPPILRIQNSSRKLRNKSNHCSVTSIWNIRQLKKSFGSRFCFAANMTCLTEKQTLICRKSIPVRQPLRMDFSKS